MKKKRVVEIVLLVALAVVLGYFTYNRLGLRMGGTPAPVDSRFQTEEDWLLDEILRDLVETAAFARHGTIERVELSVVRSPVEEEVLPLVQVAASTDGDASVSKALVLEGSFWNPQNYVELAEELLGSSAVAGGAGDDNDMLLERLLDPVSTVIEAENQRISSRLATNMLDAEAHEEAALLLGALGLKEGYFYRFADLRQVLCRITTHLALASALRQGEPLGTVGQFANATLLVLLGRQVEAFAELDRLSEKHSPAARSWIKALLLYATTDWRLPPGEAESLLERLQRFRAMATTLGTSGAIDRMGPEVHGPLADWGRIVTASYTVSAGDGSFVRTQMGKEIAEIQEIRALVTGKPLAPGEFGEALNQPAERLVTAAGPRVIGWGTWAAYYQRNICGLLIVAEEVLRDALAMPDSAEIYEEEANWLFDELTMHPIVEVNRTRHLGSRAEDIEGMEDTVTLARRRPELITPDNWNYMADTATYMMLKWSLPRADQWFSEAVLRTTVFDADLRRVLLRRKAGDASIFESLRAIAPRHRVVVHVGIDRLKDRKADVDEMIRELGDRIEFDINAVGWIGGEASDRLEDSSPLREIMCEADANDCFGLGWVLVRTGRTEEAVAVFERAVREAPDRIHVCNNCWWLVNYYFDQGRQDEALELAEMVADVYCSVGLTTLAGLLERMEQFDEAETWYERNQERYDSDALASYPLLGFYYRMARVLDQEEYEDKLQRAMQPIFTSGLEALPRTPDAEPPQGGLLLDGDSPRLQAAGLRGADVIVGLDGYRVHSMEQYDAIRWFRPRVNDMKLRVWRQTRYMDLEVESFNRYFDVRARTYGSPGPSIYYR